MPDWASFVLAEQPGTKLGPSLPPKPMPGPQIETGDAHDDIMGSQKKGLLHTDDHCGQNGTAHEDVDSNRAKSRPHENGKHLNGKEEGLGESHNGAHASQNGHASSPESAHRSHGELQAASSLQTNGVHTSADMRKNSPKQEERARRSSHSELNGTHGSSKEDDDPPDVHENSHRANGFCKEESSHRRAAANGPATDDCKGAQADVSSKVSKGVAKKRSESEANLLGGGVQNGHERGGKKGCKAAEGNGVNSVDSKKDDLSVEMDVERSKAGHDSKNDAESSEESGRKDTPSPEISGAAAESGGGDSSEKGDTKKLDRAQDEAAAESKKEADTPPEEPVPEEGERRNAKRKTGSCEQKGAKGKGDDSMAELDMALIESLVTAAIPPQQPVGAMESLQVGGLQVVPENLAKIVQEHGGLETVQKGELWWDIARDIGVELKDCTNGSSQDVAASVRRIYFQEVLQQPLPEVEESDKENPHKSSGFEEEGAAEAGEEPAARKAMSEEEEKEVKAAEDDGKKEEGKKAKEAKDGKDGKEKKKGQAEQKKPQQEPKDGKGAKSAEGKKGSDQKPKPTDQKPEKSQKENKGGGEGKKVKTGEGAKDSAKVEPGARKRRKGKRRKGSRARRRTRRRERRRRGRRTRTRQGRRTRSDQ